MAPVFGGIEQYDNYFVWNAGRSELLAAKAESLTNGESLFNNCTSLTSLPEGLSFPALTNGDHMFYRCTRLTSLPEGLSFPALTNGTFMFANCTSLTSLPEGLSFPALTNGDYMFSGCNALTTADCTKILNALPTYTSGSRTITLPNTDAAKAADTTIATNKKWTVAYA